MTPGNYTAHAIKSIAELRQRTFNQLGPCEDVAYLESLIRDLAVAEKFLLPVNGRITNAAQKFEDLVRNLRLPFPLTVIEYAVDRERKLQPGQDRSTRRIVYAGEDTDKLGYWVTTIDYFDSDRSWQPCTIAAYVPYDFHARVPEVDEREKLSLGYPDGKDVYLFKLNAEVLMPAHFYGKCRELGVSEKHHKQTLVTETCWDWQSLVDLTNVLACSNVKTEKTVVPAKLNKKRLAAGKPPFDSYHILKIHAGARQNAPERAGGGGTHASPRQHIRRGHIRRLSGNPNRGDERKRNGYTIWIEQTLVGDSSRGVITKDYELYHD